MNKEHQSLVRELLFEDGTYCAGKWRATSGLRWLDQYDGSIISEKVWNVLHSRPRCHCGKKTKYINFAEGYRQSCSVKCNHTSEKTQREKSERLSRLWNNDEWRVAQAHKMKTSHFGARAEKKLAELRAKDIIPLDDLEPGFDNEYSWQHKCGEVFTKSFKRTYSIYCPKCHVSKGQGELYEFVRKNYSGQILVNDRVQLAPKEIDIYLPELNLGFEFNGKYWHDGDGFREEAKVFEALDVGIKLMNVWETQWNKNRLKAQAEILEFIRS